MIPIPLKLTKIKEFSHGKRSIIYTAVHKNKKVAIKIKKASTQAQKVIEKEAKFLKELNRHGIGPKLIKSTDKAVVYKFIEGPFFIDWIKDNPTDKTMIKKILLQCREIDKLKINKREFTRPIKHIIIENNKPIFIDFERCYVTDNPQNVTQFCQFLLSNCIVKSNRKEILPLLKQYKKNQTNKNFKILLKQLLKE